MPNSSNPLSLVATPAEGVSPPPSGEPVLAHWTYEAPELSTFASAEFRRAFREAAAMAGGILLLGWLISLTEASEGAFGVSLALAFILLAFKLIVADTARASNASGSGEAVITPSAVMLNGRYHTLASDTCDLVGVRHDANARPPVLEFMISRVTSGRHAVDEVRVPVPAGREAEAKAVVDAFERAWEIEP